MENKELILKTLLINATQDEAETFLYLAEQYQLDPLKKEIYFIKYGTGKAAFVTGRDGYLKIANTNDNFDGIEADVVYENDILTKREDGSILITYSPEHLSFEKTKLKGAFCNVWRKDRAKATCAFVGIKDFYKKSQIWDQYTNSMILKVAESMALKRAFAINGLYTGNDADESEDVPEMLPVIDDGGKRSESVQIIKPKQIQVKKPAIEEEEIITSIQTITEEQANNLNEFLTEDKIDETFKSQILEHYKIKNWKQLDSRAYQQVLKAINKHNAERSTSYNPNK